MDQVSRCFVHVVVPGRRNLPNLLRCQLLRNWARRLMMVPVGWADEAARCDRISLMHRGRVLVVGAPQALADARGGGDLERAFIAWLQDAAREDGQASAEDGEGAEGALEVLPAAPPAEPPAPEAAASLDRKSVV